MRPSHSQPTLGLAGAPRSAARDGGALGRPAPALVVTPGARVVRHGVLAALALVVFAAIARAAGEAPGTAPLPAAAENVARPGGNLDALTLEPLVMAVVLEAEDYEMRLSEGILALSDADHVYVPIGETAAALQLPITTDVDAGTARGWFLAESRTFELDVRRGTVTVEGKTTSFEPSRAVVSDDVYVDSELLAQWWPVDIATQRSSMRINVTPREPLPMQLDFERAQRWGRLGRGGRPEGPEYDVQEIRHRLFGWPAFDARIGLNLTGGGPSNFTEKHDSALLVSGDLLYMTARLFATDAVLRGDSMPTLNLERIDPDAHLLGPLHVSSVQAGDVFLTRQEMVSKGQRGSGFTISTFPIGTTNEFNTTTLEGDAFPGWKVELHRGDQLFAVQEVDSSGRYEFRDIPLLPGRTELTLVFLGPFGERKEETRVFSQASSALARGVQYYRFGMVRQDEGVFGPYKAATKGSTSVDLTGKPRLVAEYRRGLGVATTMFAGLGSQPTEDGRSNFLTGGVDWGLGRFGTLRSQFAHELGGGVAAEIDARLGTPGLSYTVHHLENLGFTSEEISGDRRRETKVAVDGSIKGAKIRVPWGVTINRAEPGGITATLTNSIALSGVKFANTFSYGRSGITGALLVASKVHQLQCDGELDYRVSPGLDIESLDAHVQWNRNGKIRPTFGVQHDFGGTGGTTIDTALNWGLRGIWKGMDLQMTTGFQWSGSPSATVGLVMTTSYGPTTPVGRWGLAPRWASEEGRVAAWVYQDDNGNGRFDAGEKPIEGVKFRGGRGPKSGTASDGLSLLGGLSFDAFESLNIIPESLPDPFMQPLVQGRRILVRPGVVPLIAFPVVLTGEVDGTAYFEGSDGSKIPIANVQVEMVDDQGHVGGSARSEYDGFFVIQAIKPGHYRIRVSPEQVKRLHLATSGEREVQLEPGAILSNLDIVAAKGKVAPASADAPAPPATEP
jgi:hypothetical protein